MTRLALYSAVDDVLTHYAVDAAAGTLEKRSSLRLPAKVQYAWAHPSRSHLYVSTSSGGPRVASDCNHVSALAIAPDGALSSHGEPRPLPKRAVHMCLDPSGAFALNAHNFGGGGMTVHAIEASGRVGQQIAQDANLDFGIYPHQVMVFPSGRSAMIVDRGVNAQAGAPERPGALRTFGFTSGQLSAGQVVAPQGGYGFGPRHVVFHPTRRWLYVSDERTNRLYMFRFDPLDRLEEAPAYTLDLLADAGGARPRQLGGAIHLHPDGGTLYVANRSDHHIEQDGRKVFAGGENNIAVFRIDAATGEPVLMQHADTHSFHVRTFSRDAGGKLLVTASIKALWEQADGELRPVPAALSVFRIDARGALDYLRKYDVQTEGPGLQYWMALVDLP